MTMLAAAHPVSSQPRGHIWEQSGPLEVPTLTAPQLVVGATPGRIDWVLRRTPILSESFDLPILGPLAEAVAAFRQKIQAWLALAPPGQRVAFGGILLLPVQDRLAGYATLSKLLPFEVGGKTASDVSYQINRRRAITLDGWQSQLNRLSKWSVSQFHRVNIEVPGGHTRTAEVATACRLEVDIRGRC